MHILLAAKARMEGLAKPPPPPPPPPAATATETDRGEHSSGEEGASHVVASDPLPANASSQFSVATKPEAGDQAHAARGSAAGGFYGGSWASDVDAAKLSRQTQGYSGADLASLVRNAAMAALQDHEGGGAGEGGCGRSSSGGGSGDGGGSSRGVLVLARRHFETALATTRPSSGSEVVAKHEGWARQWHRG